ncbi:DUF3392 family protein [Reinekea sp.]|uniref:DUF3392 family protein n=1 Tax=Reinekea sp. TaxID=1970455 RepID=UPI002A8027F4|nr:DUF3392 family protein [Reinekea sp.]
MDLITSLLAEISSWFRPHLTFIASTLVLTLLAIYGARLNRAIWVLVRGAHFVVRTLMFVAFCVFGYGAATLLLIPLLRRLMLSAGSLWLGLVVIAAFLLLGVLAERQSRKG